MTSKTYLPFPLKHSLYVGMTLFSLIPLIAHPVHAASTTLSPELYSLIQKKLFFDAALEGTDPATLTPEQLQILYGAGSVAGEIPTIGSIILTSDGFTAISGQGGQARGAILKGTYDCTMDAIDGTSITLPFHPITITDAAYTIPIAFTQKEGTGTVIRPRKDRLPFSTQLLTFFQTIPQTINQAFTSLKTLGQTKQTTVTKPSQGFSDITVASEASNSGEEDIDPRISIVTMTLFQDSNENGIYEAYESLVPWANVRLTCKTL